VYGEYPLYSLLVKMRTGGVFILVDKISKYVKKRSTVVLGVFIVLWMVVVAELFSLQVINHKKYQQSVSENVQRMNTVSAERGKIKDKITLFLLRTSPFGVYLYRLLILKIRPRHPS